MTPKEFEDLYKQRYARIWRYFRKNRVSDAESHDLTQDTFTRFYEYMDDLRDANAENAMLDEIARTVLLNYIRYWKALRRARSNTVESDGIEGFDVAAPPADPEHEIDVRRRLEKTVARVRQLPLGQYEAVVLFVQGMSYEEIATALRTSVDGVKARLRDARRSLRDVLPEE